MDNNQNVNNNWQPNLNSATVIPNGQPNSQVNNMNNIPVNNGNTIPTSPTITPIQENQQPVSNNDFIAQSETFANLDQSGAFIQNATTNEQLDNQTYLNDMNVSGTYNKMEAPSYASDPKVAENINNHKKNTIPVTKELKTIIIISLLLLVFIIIMPIIFDLINNVRFR